MKILVEKDFQANRTKIFLYEERHGNDELQSIESKTEYGLEFFAGAALNAIINSPSMQSGNNAFRVKKSIEYAKEMVKQLNELHK